MKASIKKNLKSEVATLIHEQIQQLFGLSDFDYKLNQYEYGMKFLDQYFDETPTRVIPIATQTSYWKWWCDEWDRWEQELMDFIIEHQPVVFPKFWFDEMDALVGDHLTESSFKNYLKLIQNVRI